MHGEPDSAPGPSLGILPGRDGVHRWVHEINLWKNPTVLIATAKVLLLAALVPALFVGILALVEGEGLGAALDIVGEVGGIVIGIVALLLLVAYPLIAILQGGRYCVVFEMDERGVKHTQLRKQFRRNQALALVTVLAGIASGSPQTAGAGLLAASRQSLHTAFAKVRRIRIDERRGVIHLAETLTRNQIYAAPEDFAFVRDFIVAHCPRATVSGPLGGRDE